MNTSEHPFAQYIRILGKGQKGSRELTREEARDAMGMLLDGKIEDVQLGAFMMLLRYKEETADELAGFTQAVQERVQAPAIKVDLDWPTYAGKRRQLPWYLLAVKTLAQSGIRILLHGGGQHTQVAPGQEKTITFKAMHAGLFVYHCATPLVPQHIAAGMYGMILVEPEQGLPKVDREFYVMQGDMYTQRPIGAKVHQEVDLQKMSDELPSYYVFNGAVGALSKTHKMQAQVGETVRIYFGVGGPNKISSFHVIGEVFDKVYSEAALNTIKHSVQTTLVAPGGAAIVELKVDHPGSYLLVDHALSRTGKGAVGVLEVTGEPTPGVYKASAL